MQLHVGSCTMWIVHDLVEKTYFIYALFGDLVLQLTHFLSQNFAEKISCKF